MAGERDAVRVDGINELRRALRATDRDALKEVQKVTKAAAVIVAAEASVLAPKVSGALAASIKGTTSGNKGIVRSPLPYAAVVEWGGTISPKGAPIKFERSNFVGRAVQNKRAVVVRELERGFDGVKRRNGW